MKYRGYKDIAKLAKKMNKGNGIKELTDFVQEQQYNAAKRDRINTLFDEIANRIEKGHLTDPNMLLIVELLSLVADTSLNESED